MLASSRDISKSVTAAFYLTLFGEHSPKLDAHILATALSVYATTQSLGGTAAQAYGFTVSAAGLGAATVNLGFNGVVFRRVIDITADVDVYDILLAADWLARSGILYKLNPFLVNMVANVFSDVLGRGGL